MEALAILIFILAVVLAPFLFVGWVIFLVVRAIVGGLSHGTRAIAGAAANGGAIAQGHTQRCPTGGCHAVNPVDARFCRRCGHGLPAAQRVQVRRAAVW
ncbi:MAG: hypothetical protein QOF78_1542 [Phycisphaerales bacterium]|jgi:hypothetical protein|nr:hypothetical protein [Phycisphaerales bacterium]MEA2734682.1 Double zinc ribbon [Humisphaera sp.]